MTRTQNSAQQLTVADCGLILHQDGRSLHEPLRVDGASAPIVCALSGIRAGVGSSDGSQRSLLQRTPSRSSLVWIAVALLLATHAGLLAYSATRHSPTLNEPAHLAAGIAACKYGRFDLYPENPPLVRMVAAFPILASDAVIIDGVFNGQAGVRSAGTMGREFIKANGGGASFRFFTLARWACIPFSVIGGYICFRWARELCGIVAGFVALVLWCFSPNIIAHSQLITMDAAATSLGIAAFYCFWKWLRQPTWFNASVAASILGIAELTKFTWLVLFALWPLLWLLWQLRDSEKRRSAVSWMQTGVQVVAIVVIALCIVNLAYQFDGTFRKLGRFVFVSETLGGSSSLPIQERFYNRFADGWLSRVPVPLPAQYVIGLDLQTRDLEHFNHPSYLAGELRARGWWWYYLYGLVVKVPLGLWVLVGLVLVCRIGLGVLTPLSLVDEGTLLLPAAVVLSLASSQTAFSHHFRYILPIFPFVFVWVSQVTVLTTSVALFRLNWVWKGAITWIVVASLWVYPHSLSYFNELAGGPADGHRHMIMSSLDWGQDLIFLQEWVDSHPDARPMYVACYAGVPLDEIGLDFPSPPIDRRGEDYPEVLTLTPGWYAISVNYLCGYPWDAPERAYSYFGELQPVTRLGCHSIYLFEITELLTFRDGVALHKDR